MTLDVDSLQLADQLQAQLQNRQTAAPAAGFTPEALSQLKLEVASYQTVLELKAKLLEVLKERCQLQAQVQNLEEALATEQAAHIQTRQSLTTSLADVMEALVQVRERQPQSSAGHDQEG